LINVQNRDGKLEEFKIEKIKRMVQRGTAGLDVNPLELESKVSVAFTDGVQTKHIHDSMIIVCTDLTTPEEPDWRYVAGRFFIMGKIKEVMRERGYSYDLLRAIKDNVAKGIYTDTLLKEYTETDILYLDSQLDMDSDNIYDHAGAKALCSRYLLPDELPQEMYMTIAMMLATQIPQGPSMSKLDVVIDVYEAISSGKISLATPILINLRRPNANLASCFIMQPEDDLGSIFDRVKDVGMISKNAGGVGFNLDKIRAKGSWIKHIVGLSGGTIPLTKVLNDVGLYVDQEGKRKGSITPSLGVWHLDMMDFLEIQTEAGDIRFKSFDVFPQVVVPDIFMRRLEDKEALWTFFDPYEVRKKYDIEIADLYGEEFDRAYTMLEEEAKKGNLLLTKTIRTRDVFKAIYDAWNVKGMPYITFKDTINNNNPNRGTGVIYAANLCQESFSNFDTEMTHTCNLCSLVAPKIPTADLPFYVRLSVEILDATIELASPPVESSEKHNKHYRTVGLGVLGMHDLLAWNNVGYESDKGVALAKEFMEDVAYYAISTSVDLARTLGPAPAFAESTWASGKILGRDFEYILSNSYNPERWYGLRADIMKYGMRNTQLLAIAPNSSTALLQGVVPSILPTWDLMYVEATQLGTVIQLPYYIKERPLGYKAYRYHDVKKVNTFVAAVQTWVDSGISYDLVFDKNNKDSVSVKAMYEVYKDAWEKGIKTVYYVRWITSSGDVNKPEDSCIMCAG
jgi:ribonucleoside-diphosphate reductase alpha chain